MNRRFVINCVILAIDNRVGGGGGDKVLLFLFCVKTEPRLMIQFEQLEGDRRRNFHRRHFNVLC